MSRNENLLPLVGFCDEDNESILVYEYASNGSLDEYIRRNDYRNSFPWVMRLQSCLDAAHGLNFLHNGNGENHHPITHGNIKSSNIFFGRDGVGKIGDFGFSTPGKLTKDLDVYSFGVVLFEVLTGKMCQDDPDILPHKARHFFEQKQIYTILDSKLKREFGKVGTSDIEELDIGRASTRIEVEKARASTREEHEKVRASTKQELKKARASTKEPKIPRASISTREDQKYCPNSIKIFANIAYRCTQEKQADRPTMAEVVQQLEEAFKAHEDDLKRRRERKGYSHKLEDLKHLKIPFREIYSATRGLDDHYVLGWGGYGAVYRAELFHVDVRNKNEPDGYRRRKSKVALKRSETKGQGWREFMKEIEILSRLNHQNVISLLGFCDEYGEMILVYDFAFKGSFNKYIPYSQEKYNLSWAERLQICIDMAQGLNYLHNQHIIHCDIKSHNILLGENWEGMVGDFGLSQISSAGATFLKTDPVGTLGYIDPNYLKYCILTKQSDMYSFGAMLLEVFSAKLVLPPDRGSNRNYLVDVAKHHFPGKQLYHIIAPYMREKLEKRSPILGDEKFMASVNTFAEIAHACLNSTMDSTETHRLTMLDVLKELRKALTLHLIGVEVLSLEVINSATNCFSNKNVIGTGASAKVYKGELSLSKGREVVAVKKFNHWDAYREGEFLKKVAMLSRYVHENITPLRGFCEEGKERIIILEHAINGSLDKHLDNKTLTWGLRLKISIGAAKGLHHIHSFAAAQNTTHGDVKSGNILLHHDWRATISDFILSKGHGTLGYINPKDNSGGLTEKLDVYAFGVVLFEILSGRLAIEKAGKYPQRILDLVNTEADTEYDKDDKVVFLARAAVLCFEHKLFEDIIFDGIKNQTDAKSIDIFSNVAYQCLQDDQEKRPTMDDVIKALEKAYQIHDEWECEQKLPKDYNKIIEMSKHPMPRSITKKYLHSLLSSGVLLHKQNVWFSISSDGGNNEMVSSIMFSYRNVSSVKWRSISQSRFSKVARIFDISNLNIHIHIKTHFLTPGMMYGAYLVFQFCDGRRVSNRPIYVNLKYEKAGETLHAYFAEWNHGSRWLMVKLFQFQNDKEINEFEVLLKSFSQHNCGNGSIYVEGIEFQAIHSTTYVVSKELKDEWNAQGLLKSNSAVENTK